MTTESENTQDTQEDRLAGENMLIMDINAIPRDIGLDVDTWAKLIREQGVCFFDSTKGERPSFMNVEESIKVFDVEEEEAMGELERIMTDDNYDPELPPIPLITPTPEEETIMSSSPEGITFTDGTGRVTWNDTVTDLTIEEGGFGAMGTTTPSVGLVVNGPSEVGAITPTARLDMSGLDNVIENISIDPNMVLGTTGNPLAIEDNVGIGNRDGHIASQPNQRLNIEGEVFEVPDTMREGFNLTPPIITGTGGAEDSGSLARMEEMFNGEVTEENFEQVVSPMGERPIDANTERQGLDERYPHLAERLRRNERQTEPGFELTDDTE
jgi:hypothetical protein